MGHITTCDAVVADCSPVFIHILALKWWQFSSALLDGQQRKPDKCGLGMTCGLNEYLLSAGTARAPVDGPKCMRTELAVLHCRVPFAHKIALNLKILPLKM